MQRLRILCVVLVLLTAAGRVEAQSEPSSAAAWITPENVPSRGDALLRRLDAVRRDPAVDAELQTIETGLVQIGTDLDAALARAAKALQESLSLDELDDVRRELMSTAAPLGAWKNELGSEAKHVERVLDELTDAQKRWSATRARPETAVAGGVVTHRVDTVLAALQEAITGEQAWRARVLDISDRVVDRSSAVDEMLEKLGGVSAAERSSLFVPDRPPLWQRGFGAELRGELSRGGEEVRAYWTNPLEYITRDPRPFAVHTLLAVFLMLIFQRLAQRARRQSSPRQEPSPALRLLERPYSIALLLALLASPALHPLAPQRLMQLLALFALFPAARIVIHASERANLIVFVGLFVLLFLDRIELACAPLPALGRAVFLLSLMIALVLAFWQRRQLSPGDPPWVRRTLNVGSFVVGLAVLAELGGWTHLAGLLGRGVLAAAIAALYVYAAIITVDAAVSYAIGSRSFRRSFLIDRNTAALRRGLGGALRWLGLGLWLYLVLTALGLRDVAWNTVRSVLGASIAVGELSLSIGGVLAFVATLVGAMVVARVVDGILQEDIYPRTNLPRGFPYIVSVLVRYGVYSLGFLLALGAAGVKLGQLTILLGGFGVGVGLGLQDLVNNFAAGLTLLLERRIHVGDAVQIPSQQIFGRILAIGMRASLVRNWDGSEVVVPNSELVSTAVTNWTLSDRMRRLEVPVGVAYGTNPERVVEVLLTATASMEELLTQPAPQALFTGFGDSSLNFVLRAWTDAEYERTLPLTSALALAVHRVLTEAGITIPFPQRDLHLASISAEVGAALSNLERKG